MNIRSASKLFDSLIPECFPGFVLPVGTSFKLSGRIARWTRRRMDGLYECLVVQFGTLSEVETAIAIDCVVHYFEECPVMPGVFGILFNVTDEADDDAMEVVGPHLGGLNWLVFDSSDLRKEMSQCLSTLSSGVRQHFENAVSQLAADPFRRKAYEYCMSLDRSADTDYEQILEVLATYGKPMPIRGLDYTVGKAAHQLHAWLAGVKHWAQL